MVNGNEMVIKHVQRAGASQKIECHGKVLLRVLFACPQPSKNAVPFIVEIKAYCEVLGPNSPLDKDFHGAHCKPWPTRYFPEFPPNL